MVMEAFIRDEHGPVRLDLFRLPRRLDPHRLLPARDGRASRAGGLRAPAARASFPLVAATHALLAAALGAYEQGDARFGWVLLDPTGAVRESDLDDGPCATCALDALRAVRDRPRLRLVS